MLFPLVAMSLLWKQIILCVCLTFYFPFFLCASLFSWQSFFSSCCEMCMNKMVRTHFILSFQAKCGAFQVILFPITRAVKIVWLFSSVFLCHILHYSIIIEKWEKKFRHHDASVFFQIQSFHQLKLVTEPKTEIYEDRIDAKCAWLKKRNRFAMYACEFLNFGDYKL